MQEIQVIPVIDIRNGRIIDSGNIRMARNSVPDTEILDARDPFELMQFYEGIGFSEIYVSDLDGIIDEKPNYDFFEKISIHTNLRLMADIGIWSLEDALKLSRIKPVISTGSFTSLNTLEFPGEFIISIDTMDGELLSPMNIPLSEFLSVIKDSRRINEVILMDYAHATIGNGPNIRLIDSVKKTLPDKSIIYGGGVRHIKDIKTVSDEGISKVLVGSALNSGEMLEEIYAGFLRL